MKLIVIFAESWEEAKQWIWQTATQIKAPCYTVYVNEPNALKGCKWLDMLIVELPGFEQLPASQQIHLWSALDHCPAYTELSGRDRQRLQLPTNLTYA